VGSTKVDHELAELLRHEPGPHLAEMSTLTEARSHIFPPSFRQAPMSTVAMDSSTGFALAARACFFGLTMPA
jgi:hypothetical protein